MTLPVRVVEVCDTFLAASPAGLVTGLYLRGGIGFGEWIPGQSDIDFVAVLDHRPTEPETASLRTVHVELAATCPDVPFSGLHVLAEDLRADPRDCPPVPCVLEGEFDPEGHLDELVAWHELAWHGVTVAGRPHTELGIWTDHDALVEFTRANLATYWGSSAAALAEQPALATAEWLCTWCVLGAPRLHHLLVTGEMTTKGRAGRWGLTHYPDEHHRVLREALRIREGGADEYADEPARRGLDTLALLTHVVAAGAAG